MIVIVLSMIPVYFAQRLVGPDETAARPTKVAPKASGDE